MKVILVLAVLLSVAALTTPGAQAQEEAPAVVTDQFSEEFSDPLTTLPQVVFQDLYTPTYYGSSVETNRFLMRLAIPRVPSTSLLPVPQIIRPTVSFITQSKDGKTQTAFADLALLDLLLIPWPGMKTGFAMGIGPLFIFPTATEKFAGQGAWQVGPAFGAMYRGIPRIIMGGLIQNSFSFAYTSSDHEAINALTVQPVIAVYLGRGFYLKSGEASAKFEWKKNGAKIIPVSLALGYVMLHEGWPPLNFSVGGEQTVYRDNARIAPKTSVRFGLTVALPKWSL